MYNETQKRIIMLIKNIQKKHKPPSVRAWLFTYIMHGKVHIIAMISIRMVGEGWLRKRKRIESRLKTLKDANVTMLISGDYIKYVIEA
jgi:hypothetical protein